ncbi:hypothetical protein [Streptomyces sioyaensis]|uniref:hypothetical protein n=1 Tax=Streptomyces sioyaensis TaxID=67364 RepID=UPI003793EA8E
MSQAVSPEMRLLILGGIPIAQIAKRLGVTGREVSEARRLMGMDPMRQHTTGTMEDAYWARTRPAEGGHLLWIGPRNESGCPILPYRRGRYSALRVAFRVHYGREPSGVVRAACDVPKCVAGRCLDDAAARRRTREQLAAVLGMDHSRKVCPEGHLYAETAVYRTNGQRECRVCCAQRAAAAKAVAA